MCFSLRQFELRYRAFLSRSLRTKLIAPALALIAYSVYSLFAADWFRSEQYIKRWDTAPNVIYDVTWISFLIMGILGVCVGMNKNLFRNSVETFFQYWCLYIVLFGVLFGNRWRVTCICNVPYNEVFSAGQDKYPEIDLVMLLVGVVIYLSVYAEMRLRRLIWVVGISLLVYSLTALIFGIPLPKSVKDPNGTIQYELETDYSQATFLAISLLLLFCVALLGKFTLELLQRRNFLELELAQKRIDVLEKTINAIDDDNQPHTQLEQTHKRLKDAERIIEKVKLMGITKSSNQENDGAQLAFAQELETALALIRKTERNMTMLDFHKEVLLGPIKTGVEWKQEEVINWLESVVNPAKNGRVRTSISSAHIRGQTPSEVSFRQKAPSHYGKSPRRTSTSNMPGVTRGIPEDDLGLSARSLMKQIGFDWNLSVEELQHTLHSNQATDLSAFRMVVKATLGPVAKESLNVTIETVNGFAKAVEDLYLDVPFHNSVHAAQVCHQVNVLAEITGVRRHLSRIDQVALTVAGMCHDVSHFGRSNAFLVETRHELAVRYNDSAVLENFHAAMTFQLLKSSAATDITAGLSRREERRFRARLIQLILATDSSTHFQLVAELRMRLLGQALFEDPQIEETDRRVVLCALLRAADLGYHAIPLDAHAQWVDRLAEEYAQQGDDERALGLTISPMCDRRSQDIPSMQIGFMNLVVMPLFDELFNLTKSQNPLSLDNFGTVCGQLVSNHAHWTMARNQRPSINGDGEEQRTVDERMSDGSELYIPAPTGSTQRTADLRHLGVEEYENSSPRSRPDLIQRVYSSEIIRRSFSGSIKGAVTERDPRADSVSEDGSVVSLTYSQAHGYTNDEQE